MPIIKNINNYNNSLDPSEKTVYNIYCKKHIYKFNCIYIIYKVNFKM